jgi:hypothetical protein
MLATAIERLYLPLSRHRRYVPIAARSSAHLLCWSPAKGANPRIE